MKDSSQQFYGFLIFLVVVLIGSIYFSYTLNQKYEESLHWIPLNAVIVNTSAEKLSGKHIEYIPILNIAYHYQNVDYSNQALDARPDRLYGSDQHPVSEQNEAEDSAKKLYPVGSPIKVIIDPNHPQHARTLDYLEKIPQFDLYMFDGVIIMAIIILLSNKKAD